MAGDIRQPIDTASLERYLSTTQKAIKSLVDIKQFTYGQSNPTYLLTDTDGAKYVLRKKPPGKLLSRSAHRVDREYRVLDALQKTPVPVPRTYCLCEDDGVLGSTFYIMEFLDGRIMKDASLPGVEPEHRREMWKDAIRVLAKLHQVNVKNVGLETYGKSMNFYNRQLATLKSVSEAQARTIDIESGKPVGNIPHFEEMIRFFGNEATQPKDRSVLIHGDYKMDNLVFHKSEPRVIGILDWELSTIGHPLSDLVNLLAPYAMAHSQVALSLGYGSKAFTYNSTSGLPSQQECIGWYREVTGWDPSSDMAWGEAFGLFRNSIIMQGIAARFALRQASSARSMEYVAQVKPFAEICWSFVEKMKNRKTPKL